MHHYHSLSAVGSTKWDIYGATVERTGFHWENPNCLIFISRPYIKTSLLASCSIGCLRRLPHMHVWFLTKMIKDQGRSWPWAVVPCRALNFPRYCCRSEYLTCVELLHNIPICLSLSVSRLPLVGCAFACCLSTGATGWYLVYQFDSRLGALLDFQGAVVPLKCQREREEAGLIEITHTHLLTLSVMTCCRDVRCEM